MTTIVAGLVGGATGLAVGWWASGRLLGFHERWLLANYKLVARERDLYARALLEGPANDGARLLDEISEAYLHAESRGDLQLS